MKGFFNQYHTISVSTQSAKEDLFNKGAAIINISNYAYMLAGNTKYYGEKLAEFVTLISKNLS